MRAAGARPLPQPPPKEPSGPKRAAGPRAGQRARRSLRCGGFTQAAAPAGSRCRLLRVQRQLWGRRGEVRIPGALQRVSVLGLGDNCRLVLLGGGSKSSLKEKREQRAGGGGGL